MSNIPQQAWVRDGVQAAVMEMDTIIQKGEVGGKKKRPALPFSCYNTENCGAVVNNFSSILHLESITLCHTQMG